MTDADALLSQGFAIEWAAPGVLKPPMVMTYPEVEAWRAQRIAEGARVMSQQEWRAWCRSNQE